MRYVIHGRPQIYGAKSFLLYIILRALKLYETGCINHYYFFNFQFLIFLSCVITISECFFIDPKNIFGPRCRTVFETVYKTECSTTYIKKCSTVPSTQYRTEFEEVYVLQLKLQNHSFFLHSSMLMLNGNKKKKIRTLLLL